MKEENEVGRGRDEEEKVCDADADEEEVGRGGNEE